MEDNASNSSPTSGQNNENLLKSMSRLTVQFLETKHNPKLLQKMGSMEMPEDELCDDEKDIFKENECEGKADERSATGTDEEKKDIFNEKECEGKADKRSTGTETDEEK
ncbi:hypothetical protein ACHAWO_011245 [Cyclotella atomus]|uniref:Uncharacterized protein n=1 Tax=Cyclotella atomus TaxID=382360 RepID=A0ABD3PBM9_9STRA